MSESACNAKVSSAETCNGQDDDCDGQTDNGNLCSSDNCAVGAACVASACTAGTPKVCDDGNPCTADACDPANGSCKATHQDGLGCDDGQICTMDTTCKAGACQGGTPAAPCQCSQTSDCKDDGLQCNGVPYCDKSAAVWVCKVNPAAIVVCAKSSDGCKTLQCQEPAGQCGSVYLPDGVTCDDGFAFTLGDSCQNGVCEPSLMSKCQNNAECAKSEDGDPCNGILFCNKATGYCQSTLRFFP